MSLKPVIVTGANGFIGRQLCRQLVEAGNEVVACIRENADASIFGENAAALKIVRIRSLTSDPAMPELLRGAEAVIHLAGRAHVMHETAADPLSEFRAANVEITRDLALLARENGVRRFIYLSSIKVNGEATGDRPFLADDSPGYCDPYGQSKWEAEEALLQVAECSAMDWVVVRPPLVYGPHVRGNFLALLRRAVHPIPLPIGGIHNCRSLVSVYNLCDLLRVLIDHPGAANNRFLVSDAEDISTPQLVRRIAASVQRPALITPFPVFALRLAGALLSKSAAVQRLCSSLVLDRRKTSDLLGWTAPLDLDSGLSRTADWFLGFDGRVPH